MMLSFIIPLFNHLNNTREMLASLVTSIPEGLQFEIIFVDDGSTDETTAWLQALTIPYVSIVLNARNFGYAKSNNIGASIAKGSVLGLINNDLLFKPGWLEPMLSAIETPEQNVGVVGNLQYRVADNVLDHSAVQLTPRAQFDHIRDEPDERHQPLTVFAVTGACMLIRKTVFESVGGFDEVFINGCEDIDLCFKVKECGLQVQVVPDSRILHHVSLSRNRASLQNDKNSRYLFLKWRKQIKLQLTKCWINCLRQENDFFATYLSGELTPVAKSSPHVNAIRIAEAMILREEARWARDLGTTEINGDWLNQVDIQGLRFSPRYSSYFCENEINIYIDRLKTARNFYICGRLMDGCQRKFISLTLNVNNLQVKTYAIARGFNFNVGLIDLLLIPGFINHLKVTFQDENGINLADDIAISTLLVTHFVVDDKVIVPKRRD